MNTPHPSVIAHRYGSISRDEAREKMDIERNLEKFEANFKIL
jgi:hypothetical protein